jgi:hypothetical protein
VRPPILPRFLEPGRFTNCRLYSGGLPHGTDANGEGRDGMRAAARAIEEAEREIAGAHASALRCIGDGDDLKGAAEFASPAQMRARERPLRCFEKGSGPAPHCGLRVFGRDDQPAGHRICIRRARGSRARAASPHFLSPQYRTDAWKQSSETEWFYDGPTAKQLLVLEVACPWRAAQARPNRDPPASSLLEQISRTLSTK